MVSMANKETFHHKGTEVGYKFASAENYNFQYTILTNYPHLYIPENKIDFLQKNTN